MIRRNRKLPALRVTLRIQTLLSERPSQIDQRSIFPEGTN